MKEEGRRKKEERRGKKEEGRAKKEIAGRDTAVPCPWDDCSIDKHIINLQSAINIKPALAGFQKVRAGELCMCNHRLKSVD
ncbi:MAG: hypothetical protein HC849_08735 [Oscillatoriales cyanobacterium RU_3_3]|nr:hypothetical protein [Oscillatoriales cyanobacterium RU_3_3]NJR22752.1 hypothetical protein [Richelia sp. CSU_2_1]